MSLRRMFGSFAAALSLAASLVASVPAAAVPGVPPLDPQTTNRYEALPMETFMIPTRGGDAEGRPEEDRPEAVDPLALRRRPGRRVERGARRQEQEREDGEASEARAHRVQSRPLGAAAQPEPGDASVRCRSFLGWKRLRPSPRGLTGSAPTTRREHHRRCRRQLA